MESFTIHGLSKVFVGMLWERFYWGAVLMAVLGFLSYKIHGFHQKYQNFEYRTENLYAVCTLFVQTIQNWYIYLYI